MCVYVKGCLWWCGVSVVGCDCGRVRVVWCASVVVWEGSDVCVCVVLFVRLRFGVAWKKKDWIA